MRLIVDTSSVIWTGLSAGKDEENGWEVELEGKKIYVNSWMHGYDKAVDYIVDVLEGLNVSPHRVIFCVEGAMSKAPRTNFYKDYKATRGTRPKEAYEEFNRCVLEVTEAFRKLGAQVVTQRQVEGDDLVAYLCEKLEGDKVILSNDGDLAALIGPNVSMMKSSELIETNPLGNFPTKYIRLYKALVGDSSDNLKGAPGFGNKSWQDFYELYGDQGCMAVEDMIRRKALEELTVDIEEFKPFRRVIDGAESVYQSYACAGLYPEWVNTLRRPLEWKAGMVMEPEDYRLKKWGAFTCIVTRENFDTCLASFKKQLKATPSVCLDLETTVPEESDTWLERRSNGKGVDVIASTIVSCGLTFGANHNLGYYISVDHADMDNVSLEMLGEFLQAIPRNILTIAHNAGGFELPVLYNAFGEAWKDNGYRGMYPNMVDSRIAATYWDENQPTQGLKQLSKLLLGYEQETYEEVTTIDGVQHKMNGLSAEHVLSYGLDDCYTAQGLYNFFDTVMEIEGSRKAFFEIEQRSMYLSALSYAQGTPISLQRLRKLERQDRAAYPEHEKVLHEYLIEKGWPGSVCPEYRTLSAKDIKEIVQIVLGQSLDTQVRTPSKLAAQIAELDHEAAQMLAGLVAEEDVASINALVKRHFTASPEFNTGSFVQIGRLMYEVMGLPIRLRNKATDTMREKGIYEGNPQTDDDAINMAIKQGDTDPQQTKVLQALLEMKSINTRTGLYWEAYPKMVHWKTGRLHPELRQCSTNTRRHSGANPNIQQMDSSPGGVRSVIQPHHRKAVFVSLDLAGQELRCLCDLSKDPNMMAAYVGDNPIDLHSYTAAMVNKMTYESFMEQYLSKDESVARPADKMRKVAKGILFSVLYGSTAKGVAAKNGYSEEEAQSYLDALDLAYPGVAAWKKGVEAHAKKHGWVPLLGGTRRHLRDAILSENAYEAGKALRQASNASIQSASGNQVRTIMSLIWDSPIFEQYDVRFYWPIHDECCFSVHRDHAVPVIQELHRLMCFPFLDDVPSSSSIGIGRSYGELIEIGEVPDEGLIKDAVARCFEVETC